MESERKARFTKKNMLESRPEDALVILVILVETVKTVVTVETVETAVETQL